MPRLLIEPRPYSLIRAQKREPLYFFLARHCILSCFSKTQSNTCFSFFPFSSITLLHIFTVPSADPVNMHPPNIATITFTTSSCALIDSKHLKSATRHTFTVLSHDPEYSNPSSLSRLRVETASKCFTFTAFWFRRTSRSSPLR